MEQIASADMLEVKMGQGADAIYLGTVPLFALGHGQISKVLPWEPPTTLIYYDSPTKTQLNIDQAATSVANTLTSMVVEMQDAMRALGKSSLKELSGDDLVALDSFTAQVTGVKQVSDQNEKQLVLEKLRVINSLQKLRLLLHHAYRLIALQEKVLTILRNNQLLEKIEDLKTEYHAFAIQ